MVLVEDDPDVTRSVIRALRERGHVVSAASAGMPGLQLVLDTRPDIVLLDLGLPDVDGRTVLSMLRAVTSTPVIVVTAQDDDRSVVAALDAGADDYVVKPFTVDQVDARIRAVLRRTGSPGPEEPLVAGELRIDPTARRASLGEYDLDLTRLEFDLLTLLVRRQNEVVTKREILAQVWQQAYGGAERTVDVHLSWLRRKLGETAADPVYLHSVRGVGVRLSPPDPVA